MTCWPTRICAVRASTVDFSCTYTNTGRKQETFWVAELPHGTVDLRTAQQYSDRVQYRCSDSICTLKIEDLREDDSAEYKVQFRSDQSSLSSGSAGVQLSVTGPFSIQRTFGTCVFACLTSSFCFFFIRPDLQVWRPGARWRLKCLSSGCDPGPDSFIWYKNGEEMGESSSSISVSSFSNSYSCAVRGHEDFPSPSFCEFTREHQPAQVSVFPSMWLKMI